MKWLRANGRSRDVLTATLEFQFSMIIRHRWSSIPSQSPGSWSALLPRLCQKKGINVIRQLRTSSLTWNNFEKSFTFRARTLATKLTKARVPAQQRRAMLEHPLLTKTHKPRPSLKVVFLEFRPEIGLEKRAAKAKCWLGLEHLFWSSLRWATFTGRRFPNRRLIQLPSFLLPTTVTILMLTTCPTALLRASSTACRNCPL